MSFFAYMAIELDDPERREQLLGLLRQRRLAPTPQRFAEEHGAGTLYGFEPRTQDGLFEVELSPALDLESVLLDFPDDEVKQRHYQEIARRLGRAVCSLGEDDAVNREYLNHPLELPVVTLLRCITDTFTERPVVFALDPEFSMRFGELTELRGFDEIITGTWRAAALADLEEPLRLIIE